MLVNPRTCKNKRTEIQYVSNIWIFTVSSFIKSNIPNKVRYCSKTKLLKFRYIWVHFLFLLLESNVTASGIIFWEKTESHRQTPIFLIFSLQSMRQFFLQEYIEAQKSFGIEFYQFEILKFSRCINRNLLPIRLFGNRNYTKYKFSCNNTRQYLNALSPKYITPYIYHSRSR